MRKTQKQQAEELFRQMEQAHDQMKKYIEQGSIAPAMELLGDCQNAAISIGTLIENTEGEGHPAVFLLEEYCELVYQIYEDMAAGRETNANKIHKLLKQKLVKASNRFKNDIKLRIEAVFLPYKASMWDSLESVWQAADADPDCDAYVIPIPYYDKNPDGSFREMHYEADQYPAYVPITKYDEFDFEEHRPDMVYIHNPYDAINFVTSVHPFFYSDNLKKFTNCLVYIPYYATAGGMSEGQALCPAYINADYIVIQSEKYRKYYDERIPDSKFLALGSPKFDSVIHKCQNSPEPPKEWKLSDAQVEELKHKKVYFYNTSIGGMLGDTDIFLKKMRYVFDTFKGREDVCLLWRPHPLMESTFDSMRKSYRLQYNALKKEFEEDKIGILDETPDIDNTIALSDVYIGDAGTSVTSLFGVVGKPIFILNNYINTPPDGDDWRGEWVSPCLDIRGNDKYLVTKNNQLWKSENNDYHYEFYMDLECEYSEGPYYMKAVEIKDKIYILPSNGRHLLIIKNKKIRRIDFKSDNGQFGAFRNYYYNDKYIFLFPFKYPYMIRIDTNTEKVVYIDGIKQFNVRNINGEWLMGGIAPYGNELVISSPADNQFMFVDMDTLEVRMLNSNSKCDAGTSVIVPNGDELWLLPMKGMTIICWNQKSDEVTEYSEIPEGFKSIKWPYDIECDEKPFGNIVFSYEDDSENIVISPGWGNMYLKLDRNTGKMAKWNQPIGSEIRGKNGYFLAGSAGGFVTTWQHGKKTNYQIWHTPERKFYNIDINTKTYKEIEIVFDYNELKAHEAGFSEISEWMQYGLKESAFNSLEDLLDGNITGNKYDKEKQLKAFSIINAATDGGCGEKIYEFISGR